MGEWHNVPDRCPLCDELMQDIMGGTAENLKGKKWYEQHYKCKECGYFIRVVQTRMLIAEEIESCNDADMAEMAAGYPHEDHRGG